MNPQSARPLPPIHHRRVHAFSGFDPRGAAHDHHLAQTEAHRTQPSGLRLEVGPRLRCGPHDHTWTVQSHRGDTQVRTTHVRMGWDDVVRQHWRHTPAQWLATAGRVYAALVREVGLGRLYRLHPPALFAALWPLCGGPGGAWLLRIYGFLWRLGRAQVPALDARRAAWVEQIIAQQTADPADEVVLCGHSVGALMAVSTAAALQDDPRWQRLQAGRRTGLVTLGGCYVGLTLREGPGAQAFRAAVLSLSQAPQWAWLDVTARIDPLCLDGAHPLAGAADSARLTGPVNRSARFFQMYSPDRWKTLRRDKQRTHGLYLMTPERAGNFDLHDLLYGPRPFEQHLGQPRPKDGTP